jgi:hypothetical protein
MKEKDQTGNYENRRDRQSFDAKPLHRDSTRVDIRAMLGRRRAGSLLSHDRQL